MITRLVCCFERLASTSVWILGSLMVRLDSRDAFFGELTRMFELCKHRGAGTVYTTVKQVKAGKGAPSGDSEGWLARAKISNNKARKISVSVRAAVSALCSFSGRLRASMGATAIIDCWLPCGVLADTRAARFVPRRFSPTSGLAHGISRMF